MGPWGPDTPEPGTPRRGSRAWVRPVVIVIAIARAALLALYFSQVRFFIREVPAPDVAAAESAG